MPMYIPFDLEEDIRAWKDGGVKFDVREPDPSNLGDLRNLVIYEVSDSTPNMKVKEHRTYGKPDLPYYACLPISAIDSNIDMETARGIGEYGCVKSVKRIIELGHNARGAFAGGGITTSDATGIMEDFYYDSTVCQEHMSKYKERAVLVISLQGNEIFNQNRVYSDPIASPAAAPPRRSNASRFALRGVPP